MHNNDIHDKKKPFWKGYVSYAVIANKQYRLPA